MPNGRHLFTPTFVASCTSLSILLVSGIIVVTGGRCALEVSSGNFVLE